MGTKTSIERRAIELRADTENAGKVCGYAARFNSVYDMGYFTEEVSRDAFNGADMSDVVALFNHDKNIVLGRTTAGTLRIKTDENGLWFDFDPPKSPNGENVKEGISRGDIKQASWGFTISDDEWSMRNGKDHRIITKVARVYDVSPVTFPANPDTTAAIRSLRAKKVKRDMEAESIENELPDADDVAATLFDSGADALDYCNHAIDELECLLENYQAAGRENLTAPIEAAITSMRAAIDAILKDMISLNSKTGTDSERDANYEIELAKVKIAIANATL